MGRAHGPKPSTTIKATETQRFQTHGIKSAKLSKTMDRHMLTAKSALVELANSHCSQNVGMKNGTNHMRVHASVPVCTTWGVFGSHQ
jgi:hypothetical protein